MRDAQRHVGVLLHQEDGGPVFLVDLADGIEDELNKHRRKAKGGLVQEQELGPAHEPARYGKHLLFASRERPAQLVAPLGEPGEQLEDVIHILSDTSLVLPEVGPHVEILGDGHVGEYPPALRDLYDPEREDPVRTHAVDGLAHEVDLAIARRHDTADGHERGGLAGAVRADQRHDLSLGQIQGDALERMDAAIVGVEVLHLKHQRPPRGMP